MPNSNLRGGAAPRGWAMRRAFSVAACATVLVAIPSALAPIVAHAAIPRPIEPQRPDTVVRLAASPRHAGVAIVTAEVTVDGSGTPGGELGIDIGDVLWARDGGVWLSKGGIADPLPALWLFDSSGTFVRVVSGRGRGPGEYQVPRGLTQLPDGRVVLRDARLPNTLSLYRPNGVFDTTWTFTTVYGGGASNPRPVSDTSGVVWLEFVTAGAGARVAPGSPLPPSQCAFARIASTGRLIDTIPCPELPDVNPQRQVVDPLYWPRGAVRVSPLGYVASYITSRYSVDLRIPTVPRRGGAPTTWRQGDAIVSLRRSVTPPPLSTDERRDHERYINASSRGGSVADIPRAKPPIREVQFDQGGRIWVAVSTPSERRSPPGRAGGDGRPSRPDALWRSPIVYDVYESDGAFVGSVGLPDGAYPVAIRGDRFWAVVRSEDGPRLVRYRIVWG